ncbi:MAG: putative Ig domain-containing protein, partial [Isosphaeraceae bacterium]
MSRINWDGGGGDSDWNNPLNWDADILPGPADDAYVELGAPGGTVVAFSTGSAAINSLHSGKGLAISGGTFSIATTSEIAGAFALGGGTLAGDGDLTIGGTTTWTGGSMTGAGRTVTQAILTISGTAAKSIDERRLEAFGTTNWSGGTVTASNGASVKNQPSATMTISSTTVGGDVTLTNAGTLTVFNTTVNGPGTLTNAAGGALMLANVAINAALANAGTVTVGASGGTLSGGLSNAAGAVLRVQPGSFPGWGGDATLTVAQGFTNAGAIDLTTSAGNSGTSRLAVTAGALVNAGAITASAGGGGGRVLAAELDNRGSLTVSQPLTLAKASARHANSGAIDVAGGNLTVTQSGTAPGFANAGTITVGAGRTLAVSGGTLGNFSNGTLTGGTYNVSGTFQFPNAAVVTIAADVVLDGAFSRIIDQNGKDALTNLATVSAGGRFTIQGGRNHASTGELRNAGQLTIATGSILSAGDYIQDNGTTTVSGTLNLVGLSALKFDGTDDYIKLPNSLVRSSTKLTLEARFQGSSPGVIFGYQTVTPFSTQSGRYVPAIYVGTDGKLRGEFWFGKVDPITSSSTVTDGSWHHVALVGDVNTQSLYLDGQLVGTKSGAIDHQDMVNNQIGLGNANSNYWPSSPGGGTWFPYAGTIDEIRVWNVPRSQAEVQATMQERLTGSESGLVAYLPLDEGAGTTALDRSGHGNDGALGGGVAANRPAWVPSGPVSVRVMGGALTGSGVINADVFNGGQVSPGVGIGALTVNGNYTQALTGTLDLELGGLNAGTEFDMLNVSGVATLDGTLHAGLVNGFVPRKGDRLSVVNFGSRVGAFAQLTEGAPDDRRHFDADYTAADVGLVSTAAGIDVSPISGLVTTSEGGTAQFTVVLASRPSSAVTIGLRSSDPTQGSASPTGLTFTPLDWDVPRTVTVTGFGDGAIGSDVLYRIITDPAVSADPNFSGLDSSDVSVTNLERDTRDLTVTNLRVSPSTGVLSGSGLTVLWDDANSGNVAAAGPFRDSLTVTNLTTGQVLTTAVIPYDAAARGPVAGGASAPQEFSFTLPTGTAGTGDIRVSVTTDSASEVAERNNAGSGEANNAASVTVTSSLAAPDLQVTGLTVVSTTALQSGVGLTVRWRDENTGNVPVTGTFYDRLVVTNATTGEALATSTLVWDGARDGAIPAGAGRDRQYALTLPDGARGAGELRFSVTTDVNNAVAEFNENGTGESNNASLLTRTSALAPYPDLQIAGLTAEPDSGWRSGGAITLRWDDVNNGEPVVPGPYADTVSVRNTNTGELLAAGSVASGTRVFTFTLPDGARAVGAIQVTVTADSGNAVFEYNASGTGESNNAATLTRDATLAPYPDLEVSGVTAPALVVGDPARVTVGWTVTNRGTGPGTVATWYDRVIASADNVLGNADDVPLATFEHSGLLGVGESYPQPRSETILLPPGFKGRYRVFVKTDATDAVFEEGAEANNAAQAGQPLDVTPTPYADLVVSAVDAPATGGSGRPLHVSWTVTNQGIGLTSTPDWSDTVRLTSDQEGLSVVANLGAFAHKGHLPVGGSYPREADVTLPDDLAAGTYYVVVSTGGPYEFLYATNNQGQPRAVAVTLTPTPDLAVESVAAPAQAVSGSKVDLSWTVRNVASSGDAVGSWVDAVVLKKLGGTSADEVRLGSFAYGNPLEAGKAYTRSEQFTLPANIQGLYQVEVTTNAANSLYERGATANNKKATVATTTIALAARPDLQVQTVTAPAQVQAGGTVALEFVVVNQGPVATATPHWVDKVYFSLDNQVSGDDVLVGTLNNGAALGSQESYLTPVPGLVVPPRFRGPAFLIVQADAGNAVDEYPNEGNNTSARPVDVLPLPPADLVISDVVVPAQALDGSRIEVRYKVTNRGANPTDATNWTDTIWLTASKNRPDPRKQPFQDRLLLQVPHTGGLAVDGSYEQTVTVTLPERLSGQFYVTPWADSYDAVLEDMFSDVVNPDDPNEQDGNNYKAAAITVLQTPTPDLTVASVSPQASAVGGEPFTVRWTVKNIGSNATREDRWDDQVYLSNSPNLNDTGATRWLLGDRIRHEGRLGDGESYTAERTFLLSPDVSGTYVHVLAGPVWEGPYTNNNSLAAPTQVAPRAPADLRVASVSALPQNFSGEKTAVTWTVVNDGAEAWPGTSYWVDDVYVSPDATFIPQRATLLDSVPRGNQPPLGPGVSYTQTREFTLPRGIGGDYHVHVLANPEGTTRSPSTTVNDSISYFATRGYEVSGNNLGSAPLPVTYREPDLTVTSLTVPGPGPRSGETIPVTWTVANVGGRDTRESSWVDRIYLSVDASLDPGDVLLGEASRSSPLAKGLSYTRTLDLRLPDGIEGDFHVLVFTDSNLAVQGSGLGNEPWVDSRMARVPEFQGEGNNIAAKPLRVDLSPAPDLVVDSVVVPAHATAGQTFGLTYTVMNVGPGGTPATQAAWDDLIYLSRDPFLDLRSDRYLGSVNHKGGLAAGRGYTVSQQLRAPRDLTGSYYVFVITDPPHYGPRGVVFEQDTEANNATPAAVPMIIDLPPAADLQVDVVTVPGSARSGDPIQVGWTVTNRSTNPAEGSWTDAVYLSRDTIWDISDVPLGRVTHTGTVLPSQGYPSVLKAVLPPATPGQYHVIVRTDVFNEVFEGPGEANNRVASADVLAVTVDELRLGVPLATTLSTGQERLYQVAVGPGQTLRVDLSTAAAAASNEIFLRRGEAPTGVLYDASYQGPLRADQSAVIPATQPGVYYVLVRGHSEPAADTPVTLLADLVPFGISDVATDTGGDGRYVTTTVLGAQFQPDAIVKLARPGFAEFEPVRYQVVDATRIVAVFDLTGAPHGLYDVEVINPDGRRAVVPYRYLVERALEPDVAVGLGGPQVLNPGETGTFGVSLKGLSNVDTPYVYFQYGVPELGANPTVFGFKYVAFSTNLRGQPEGGGLGDLPWASLDSAVNASGEVLAPGYAIGLPTGGYVGRTFTAQTYPGLAELLSGESEFAGLRAKIYGAYPQYQGLLDDGPEGLDSIYPGLSEIYAAITQRSNPLADVDPFEVAFQFHVMATATPLTREEFVAQQTAEAQRLRTAILADSTATRALAQLAADPGSWTSLYLAALEDAGVLRPEGQAPPARQSPQVLSLMATLATGLLVGPVGDEVRSSGDLVAFFSKVRQWYGDDGSRIGSNAPPAPSDYDLGLARPTQFVAFNVFVPFSNELGDARVDVPPGAGVRPPDFSSFFNAAGQVGRLATLVGPLGFGDRQFLPTGQALPYAITFENPSGASAHVGEVRIVTQLDAALDPRSFRLGDLRLGDMQVHVPAGRGSFQGDFDFVQSKGFILRVSAGLDVRSNTASWLLQAIDPDTGEVVQGPDVGLLAPNNAQGVGSGSVGYTIVPQEGLASGAEVRAQARVLFNTMPPQDTTALTQVIDGVAPATTLHAEPLVPGGADYLVRWTATDDADGSGVKHVTVYVSEDGGAFAIWLRRTTEASAVYRGTVGHAYEFLALATDNAGNTERPPLGIQAPSDGSGADLGGLPTVPESTEPDLTPAPAPSPAPSANTLFAEAEQGVPSARPEARPSEFAEVLRPFRAEAFATGIAQSRADIGPMAIAVLPDHSVLASGGPGRNQLFRFTAEGGDAGRPLAVLPFPVFDLALDAAGGLWATTGGGPLLKLDPQTGAILGQFGDGLTQALAVRPGTGQVYVSSGKGVEVFDPPSGTFRHFSDVRVGSLAFAPDGTPWAATWPNRGGVVRFDAEGRPETMLRLDLPVDSIAFGADGTPLAGLLFVSSNDGFKPGGGGQLTMVDLATLRRVALATGGTRGDVVRTTTDGRVLLSQSHQIDVLGPLRAPRVAGANPPSDALASLPLGSVAVTFDRDMLAGDPADPHSVLNPANYELTGTAGGPVAIRSVAYDRSSRTAVLSFDAISPDVYRLRVGTAVRSAEGVDLAEAYSSDFLALADFASRADVQFSRGRSSAADRTVSYDVTITNTAGYDLRAPLYLSFDHLWPNVATPAGATGPNADGAWWVDLSADLTAGRFGSGQSITRTVTFSVPSDERLSFKTGLLAFAYPNAAPVFDARPVSVAAAGQSYQYQAASHDPDGVALTYVLTDGPQGMAVNEQTGLVRWSPTASSPAQAPVVLQVYDARGGHATQEFTVAVAGVNREPVVDPIPGQVRGEEGQPLTVLVRANDPDGDRLAFWADHLPPGAVFDPERRTLSWTPDARAAGTYEGVRFVVSDGLHQVTRVTTLLIAPTDQAPLLSRPADRTALEGEPIRIALAASDPDGDALTFSSRMLPGGASLDPLTGVVEWTPAYFQHGAFSIPFTVSDGQRSTTQTTRFTVLNVNAAPAFGDLGSWEVREGQALSIRTFAFDADNPSYVPPDRLADGTLTPLESAGPSVTYAASGLPQGASFDAETAVLAWTPGYADAGLYPITVTATDDGDGTGTPLVTSRTVAVVVLDTNRSPAVAALANRAVDRGAVLEVPLQASDPDGNPMVLSVLDLPRFGQFLDDGNGNGRLRFSPGDGDRGNYTITVRATDDGDGGGPGAVLAGEQTFVLTVNALNERPRLSLTGNKVAVVGQTMTFTLTASDPDQEPLAFTAEGLPGTATLAPGPGYGTATVTWAPAVDDLGVYDVTFQVADQGNGHPGLAAAARQTIHLIVRDANRTPVLTGLGDQVVSEGHTLTLALAATDPDGDSLFYAAANLPPGATLDPTRGVLSWTPGILQAGDYPGIALSATDGDLTASETITIRVRNVNQAPVLVPTASQSGREGTPLQFTLAAGDVDADPLTFFAVTALPQGAQLDPKTGQFRWTPGYEQAGEYTFEFGVRDPAGLTDALDVSVRIVDVNRPPTLRVGHHAVALGRTLRFSVVAGDPDLGATLLYSAVGLPQGATFNPATGAFSWTPGPGQAGDHVVAFSVSDGSAVTSASALIRAAVTPEAPRVTIELTPSFPAVPGQKVLVHAVASGLAEIVGLTVTAGGQALTIDDQGRAEFVPQAPGRVAVEATATDADGLVGRAEAVLKVRDPNDLADPVVSFAARLAGARLTAAADVVGVVDDANLDFWSLERAPLGSDDFTAVAGGHGPASGALATFDPSALPNGAYRLRLTAADVGGRVSVAEVVVEASTAAKPTQYLRAETDLSVALAGATIDLVRAYDSLTGEVSGTFGFGWRLANRDADVRTDVPPTGREALGAYNPFRLGTRVFLTLPDGRRVGFTFAPERRQVGGLTYYMPAFEADPGVEYRLDSAGRMLTLAGDRLYDLKSGRAYDPAGGLFAGPEYTLTAPDGTAYHLSTARGVEAQVLPDGTVLVYSDSGITAPTGEAIRFVHDAAGRLTSVTAPDGTRVIYGYDGAGNLLSARDLASGESVRYGYEAGPDHRLALIASSEEGASRAVGYAPAPQALPVTADLGGLAQSTAADRSGALSAGSTDRYVFAVRPSELRSTATGTVLLGVSVEAAPGGALQPAVPAVPGLTPLVTRAGAGSAFALYVIDREGLQLLEVAASGGATSGAYRLGLFVAGDVDRDGSVDGIDGQLLAGALGASTGEPGYLVGADANRDGTINGADVQLLGSNLGFQANRPPVVTPASALTHADLPVDVQLAGLAADAEGDIVSLRVVGAHQGFATPSLTGQVVTFTPASGFSGSAGFQIVADDGYSHSASANVVVNVSAAPLIEIKPKSRGT